MHAGINLAAPCPEQAAGVAEARAGGQGARGAMARWPGGVWPRGVWDVLGAKWRAARGRKKGAALQRITLGCRPEFLCGATASRVGRDQRYGRTTNPS